MKAYTSGAISGVKNYEDNFSKAELIVPEWDYRRIRREAADLANGCHFLILKCDKKV